MSLFFTYDAQLRLVAATDALGQVTTIAYTHPTDPLTITAVEDPFGRRATFEYTAAGQLAAITDTLGLRSSFLYGPEDFIEQMTTPYGTTTFRHEATETEAVHRVIEATDPTGATERLVFSLTSPDVPVSDNAADVPAGFALWNAYLNDSVTLYWDKRAAQTGLGDPAAATITKWMWAAATPGWATSAIPLAHSVKRPLERRVWYAYQGQPVPPQRPETFGALWKRSRIGRVLDDGSSQIREFTYNSLGNVLTEIDPIGRRTAYTYAANGRDVLEVRNTTGTLSDLLASSNNYTTTGQPQTMTDAAGQTTSMTYNTSGQPLTVTNPKNETTTYTYDTLTGQIATVTGPLAGSTTTYTYDGYGRLRTVSDPDGYMVTTDYDIFDRPIRVTYPNDGYEAMTYDKLDLATRRDRLGRLTRYAYDSLRRLVATRDPLGRTITQDWCGCGSLNALIDAKGQKTTWERDVQGRVTREVRADGTTETLYT